MPPKSKNDILQGTLALLVLRTIDAHGPVHGYAVTNHIHRISNELLRVEEGSLYPALHRMELEGWIKAEWGVTDKGRQARFYKLTAAGRKQLASEQASWDRLITGVALVLGRA
jgi:PadR family transcriptional regulator, regulatory protein PadR